MKALSLQVSGEMYLEIILILKKNSSYVRSIDIVNHTGYTKPSVSRAVELLMDKVYIEIDEDGYIDFTERGERLASNIYEKHVILNNFL